MFNVIVAFDHKHDGCRYRAVAVSSEAKIYSKFSVVCCVYVGSMAVSVLTAWSHSPAYRHDTSKPVYNQSKCSAKLLFIYELCSADHRAMFQPYYALKLNEWIRFKHNNLKIETVQKQTEPGTYRGHVISTGLSAIATL